MLRPLALALAILLHASSLAQEKPAPRVTLLVFEGLDHNLVKRWTTDTGPSMPFFAELAKRGTYRPLRTVNPVQQPVTLGTLVTGNNPGKTNLIGYAIGGSVPSETSREYSQIPNPLLGILNSKRNPDSGWVTHEPL